MFLVSRVFRDLAGPCPPLLTQPLLTEGWFAKTESTSWQTSLFPWSDKVVFFVMVCVISYHWGLGHFPRNVGWSRQTEKQIAKKTVGHFDWISPAANAGILKLENSELTKEVLSGERCRYISYLSNWPVKLCLKQVPTCCKVGCCVPMFVLK